MTISLLIADNGVNIATVLGLPIAVASLTVSIWSFSSNRTSADFVRELARKVARERERALRQALADAADSKPADIRFRIPDPRAEPELVIWRADGGATAGTLLDIAEYYRTLQRGRLVILGDPGAGKTVLASQLVVDTIHRLLSTHPGPESEECLLVPVLVSLPSLNLGESDQLLAATGEKVGTQLDEWIVRQLATVYGVPFRIASQLVAERRILPVLDGLDEMDEYGQIPSRALAIVRALNDEGRRPVVVICRRATYRELARSQTRNAGDAPVLQDAQAIVLQPLTPTQICQYLARRFPGQVGEDGLEPRWHPVRDLLMQPIRTSRATHLIEVLGSPWRLFLAVSAYHGATTQPKRLVQMPSNQLTEHLLAELVPAVTDRHRRTTNTRDHYDPVQVTAWLAALAGHLNSTSRQLGWSSTSLYLDRLWPLAGWRFPRYVTGSLTAVVLLAVGAAISPLVPERVVPWTSEVLPWASDRTNLFIVLAVVLPGTLFSLVWQFRSAPRPLNRLSFQRLRTTSGKRRTAAGIACGISISLVAWHNFEIYFVLAAGIVVALAATVTLGLSGGVESIDRPSSLLRQGLGYDCAVAASFGIAGWLLATLVFGLAIAYPWQFSGIYIGSEYVLVIAAERTGWIAFGIALGFAYSRWPRYWIATTIAAIRGRIPWRPARFLDWAYYAGLLRLSGTAIEFRHKELQSWLERQ